MRICLLSVRLLVLVVDSVTSFMCHHCMLCSAKPKQQKRNQTHRVATDDLFTSQVEKRSKMPHSDAGLDDISSSSSKTTSGAVVAAVTDDDDIFAAASAVKTTRPSRQTHKSAAVTNVFITDKDDDDDDIFAIKPSSASNVKLPAATAVSGSSTQQVCCWLLTELLRLHHKFVTSSVDLTVHSNTRTLAILAQHFSLV